MKIRLAVTIPVDDKHSLFEGRVMEAKNRVSGIWVKGDTGEDVKILRHEYEVVVPSED